MISTVQIGSSFAYLFVSHTPQKTTHKNKIAYHERLHHAYQSGYCSSHDKGKHNPHKFISFLFCVDPCWPPGPTFSWSVMAPASAAKLKHSGSSNTFDLWLFNWKEMFSNQAAWPFYVIVAASTTTKSSGIPPNKCCNLALLLQNSKTQQGSMPHRREPWQSFKV